MTKELYDENYFRSYVRGSDDPQYAMRVGMYRQELVRIQAYKTEGAVLDIGCGTGEFLDMFPADKWQKFGIEISDFAREHARKRGIVFDFDTTRTGMFDLVIFRGTIQHIDDPITAIRNGIRWLKPGGFMVFLATPNTGGICYRLFQDLPMIAPKYNFILVSDRILDQTLTNFDMEVVKFEYPYLGTPYENWPRDILRFVLRLFGVKSKFPFWGNVLECYARKPDA